MKINGQCHCGFVSYEAEIDPANVSICHCADCQTLTGTAYRTTAVATEDDFHLTGGEPAIYVRIANSGNRRAQAFCPHCGTPIYATGADHDPAVDGPRVYGLRTGAIRQRRELAPVRAIWCSSALPWAEELGDIPHFPQEQD